MAIIYAETAMMLLIAVTFPLSYIIAEYSEKEIKNLAKKFTDKIIIPVFVVEIILFGVVLSLSRTLMYPVGAALLIFNLFIFSINAARKWDFARSILYFLVFLIVEFIVTIVS
ncbi:MAG: hypothetical protein OH316_01800 [Candidatus Parvarchaeota archaeon]|nr:hypothetical protein [Candidatus Parvarchaeota archaeon]MCW1301847.1 hypothetical protein [Candidatus Parvarchaeota archaeon]